jgi:hypothetical protein
MSQHQASSPLEELIDTTKPLFTMKIKYFFILTIILSFNLNANPKPNGFFYKLSPEEKKKIEILFTRLFKLEPFAYTIYFDKPMAFSEAIIDSDSIEEELKDIQIDEYVKFTLTPYSPSKRLLKEAWQTLEKYRSFFNNEKYLFLNRKFNDLDFIILINKPKFREMINKHNKFFKKILGNHFSADELLSQIEQPNSDLKSLLKNNHALLGILLGFGKHNAQLYEMREQLYSKQDALDYLKDYKNKLKIQEKIEQLWQILQYRNDYYTCSLNVRHQVGYACDRQHPESIELEKKYENQTREINKILDKENWLEEIILALTR